MMQARLPISKLIIYSFGMMGWSIMINLISVILVYLYAPPKNSGFPVLISQSAIFGVFNLISIITVSGRFVDAIVDPAIAHFSDKSKNPKGRRTPFMKFAILPSLIFCFLVFYPLKQFENQINVYWLVVVLIAFYISTTTYIIPYNALIPELAPNSKEKVRLSTFQSAGYVFGIGIASNAFNISDKLQHTFGIISRLSAIQYTVALFAILAACLMSATAWLIDETKYTGTRAVSAVPIKQALKQTLTNRNFQFFIVADFSYFIGVTIITSGLLYFVTVLLRLPESIGNKLMITMVLCSFIFYPVVNYLSSKIGKKPIVIASLLLLALVFGGIFFLGWTKVDPYTQIFSLIVVASIPVASLNILPVAILSEVIARDTAETGSNKEAMYFAVRFFFVKIAQSLGMGLFAMLLIYGKDIGHDFGIRLNGILGFGLCVVAAIIFSMFREESKDLKK